jgi:TonB-linked SusC/RagA family outer membrane protein
VNHEICIKYLESPVAGEHWLCNIAGLQFFSKTQNLNGMLISIKSTRIRKAVHQIVFAVLFSAMSQASPNLTQELLNERISLSVKNGTLKTILRDIEKQVDLSFSYQKNVVASPEKISIEVKNESLDEILKRVLSPRNISYQVVKTNQVVLTKMTVEMKEPGSALELKATPEILEKQIAGKITDEKGEGLPGVSIVVKGSQKGTTSESNGTYRLAIPDENTVLIFSFVGYISEEKVVGDQSIMNVVLKVDNKALEEVVVTAYGQKQRKEAVVGAVTTIRPSDLKIPASNLTTAIAGRLSGVIGYQRSGEPGVDNATFFIRGITTFGTNNSPLILVDNVEMTTTDLARLQPDDIESFSILKDASATALYGARGANGVVYVTTKQGKAGKAKINFRIENSVSMPTKNVELADPITYMKLYNEAQLTRDPLAPIKYPQNQIDNTLNGSNPYIYPATDWRDALFKKYTQNRRGNLSVSGGGEVAQYYVATSFSNDNGILKVDKMNNFNNNVRLNNYSIRSNVNINVSPATQLIVRLYGNFDDYNGPIDGGSGIYQKALKTSPTSYPAFYAPDKDNGATDHILFGNFDQGQYLNPYADMVKGYKQYSRSKMLTQLELIQKLDFLTPGLSVRGLANVNRSSYFDVTRAYNPYFYRAGSYDKQTDTYRLNWLNQQTSNSFFSEPATEYLNYKPGDKNLETFLYLQGTADYTRVFNEVHSVNATIVTTLQQSLKANSGPNNAQTLQLSLPSRNTGVSGRLSYSFDNRYFAEFNFGYNGSERFYKTKQFGFFPTIGGAWVISNESFWKPMERIVNKLKVRASYGLVGNDAIGSASDRFFFLSEVNLNDPVRGATFGFNSNMYRDGISIRRYENRNITWETSHQTNLGLEFSIMQKLNVIAEIYKQRRSNILMTRASIPSTMGLSVTPQANVGEAKSKGFDLAMDFNQNFADGSWLIARGNLTMARGIYSIYEEPDYENKYLSRVGQSITQPMGLIAERLFIDANDVNNSPRQNFGLYAAGDIKYRDINHDGQITNADFVPIGHPETPEITYGFGLSAGRGQFDFSLFFQGLGRESFFINPIATAPFINYSKDNNGNDLYPSNFIGENALVKAFADSHWSESNQDMYAMWPRLSTSINNNNSQRSTWYMRDGSFLRLKTLEAGYTVKGKWLESLKITNMRVYFSGTNLLTFSKFKLWDPEMGGNGLGYPVQRVYNIGLNLNF